MSEDGLDTGPANTAPHPSFIANKFLSGNHQFWGKWICITDIFYINIRCVGSGAASPARAARHIFHTHNKSRALTRSCCNPFGLRVILLPSNRHICELTMGHKLHLTFANYFPSALKGVFVNTRVLFISGTGPKVRQCSTAKARLFPEWQGWRKLIEWVVVRGGGGGQAAPWAPHNQGAAFWQHAHCSGCSKWTRQVQCVNLSSTQQLIKVK